ncbi:MAG TPA: flagellar motor protein MotB, partial [Kofleriaceae bacterium]|nr:flagellar motor protein MotB [Kofleriaceae bacterium]
MPAPVAQPGRRRVIKKVAGHGHHGGAWKIAYADFVTAMMALFLVLWLLASTDQKSRNEIARYFRTGILPDAELAMSGGAQYVPSIIERSPTPPAPQTESISDAASSVKEQIDKLVENHTGLAELANKVRVTATEQGVLIEVVDDKNELLFDSASSRLNHPLEEFLQQLGPILASRREPIEIQGHTDARPFVSGAGKTNWDLSYERADAAREILEQNGLKPERIVGVIGRGSAVPLDQGDPFAARNRRLSVLLRTKPIMTAIPAADPGAAEGAFDGDAPDGAAAGQGADPGAAGPG